MAMFESAPKTIVRIGIIQVALIVIGTLMAAIPGSAGA